MNAALLVLIGTFTVTSYQSVPSQTDTTPFRTSINERVGEDCIAVHPSLLCPMAKKMTSKCTFTLCNRGPNCPNRNAVHYGDWVYIEGVGKRQVKDCMARHTKMGSRWDVWVASLKAEKAFHQRFKAQKLKVWRILNGPANEH